MLTLYYAPGACSLSPHIALREAQLPFELAKVDFKSGKKLPDGRAFTEVNRKGYVPALGIDAERTLTEGVAIIQYIADQAPDSRLAPRAGTFERVRLQEWLNFIATELHKGMGPLFSADANDTYKAAVIERVKTRFAFIADELGSKPYLLGEFSIADGYLFYALRAWQRFLKQELPAGLAAYYQRVAERPAVKAALEAEHITA